MPKAKVLDKHARRMVNDVNCYMKKETDVIVRDLKLVKNTTSELASTLEKNVKSSILSLQHIKNRSQSEADISLLTEICNKIVQMRDEALETSKRNEHNLQMIINNLKQCQKRTALATNTSVATIRRIQNEPEDLEFIAVSWSPENFKKELNDDTEIINPDIKIKTETKQNSVAPDIIKIEKEDEHTTGTWSDNIITEKEDEPNKRTWSDIEIEEHELIPATWTANVKKEKEESE